MASSPITSSDSSQRSASTRYRISVRQRRSSRSRIAHPGQIANQFEELPPFPTLRGEHLASLSGDPVVAATTLTSLFHPPALNPFAFFELVERRVERGEVERQCA